MRVRAKCWINYNGVWHKGGEEFEVADCEEVKEYAIPLVDTPQIRVADMKDTPKRGRTKKTGS